LYSPAYRKNGRCFIGRAFGFYSINHISMFTLQVYGSESLQLYRWG
jgi:hypothetical protein